ncbi:MAG: hypothetical protein FJ386_00035 [Verrucomicrobia bacterium]|nr:hypothetical protein [Verrucomicrobiota bacterium]
MLTRRTLPQVIATLAVVVLGCAAQGVAADAGARWFKGNLHTHSFWSDGDDFPEMIADWYRTHGYDFLAISDHNTFQDTNRFREITGNRLYEAALEKYQRRFGDWVETEVRSRIVFARLKTFDEFRKKVEEPGKFLLIRAEEITDSSKLPPAPVHINGINLRKLIKPLGGSNIVEIMQNNFDAVDEQRRATGVPMFAHLNHPNFGFAITAEEFMQVRGQRFFEVYNGHNRVYNFGHTNATPGMDRFWDIVLTWRLGVLGLGVVYGVGTDDSHHYHDIALYKGIDAAKKAAAPKKEAESKKPKETAPAVTPKTVADDAAAARDPNRDLVTKTYSGRGWVVVRAPSLAPESIVAAMEAGDFYASNGVKLRDVRRGPGEYRVEIEPEAGVSYTTQFIGTRKGFNRDNQPVRNAAGERLRKTHTYSADVGAILAEVKGPVASYRLKGDEIYVRARVISTKTKQNPSELGEVEQAWAQPLVTGVK